MTLDRGPGVPGPPAPAPEPVTLRQAAAVWARIGLLGFGGPAGQIALMHAELVERRRWLSESRFLHALNYCMLLPGPEAQQLAIYIGWLLHRSAGGVIAGMLFVLPGLLAILALALLYVGYGQLPLLAAAFAGLKAAVLAVVLQALVKIGRRSVHGPVPLLLAAAAFLALSAFGLPFPLVIAAAGAVGLLLRWLWPGQLAQPAYIAQGSNDGAGSVLDSLLAHGALPHVRPSLRRAVRVAALWLALWWLPVLAVLAVSGADSVLGQQGLFFSQAAVLTFGGAYAVLAYVGQRMVEDVAWLTPGQMVDGLALSGTLPGPLVLVLPFLAFLAGFGHDTALPPLAAGMAAALLAAWATFVPSFLWIFLGAPYSSCSSRLPPVWTGRLRRLRCWRRSPCCVGASACRRSSPWPRLPASSRTWRAPESEQRRGADAARAAAAQRWLDQPRQGSATAPAGCDRRKGGWPQRRQRRRERSPPGLAQAPFQPHWRPALRSSSQAISGAK